MQVVITIERMHERDFKWGDGEKGMVQNEKASVEL